MPIQKCAFEGSDRLCVQQRACDQIQSRVQGFLSCSLDLECPSGTCGSDLLCHHFDLDPVVTRILSVPKNRSMGCQWKAQRSKAVSRTVIEEYPREGGPDQSSDPELEEAPNRMLPA